MKDPKKAKWVLGASGILLSAAILTQINSPAEAENTRTNNNIQEVDQDKMAKKEKELVQLDWTNFEVTSQPAVKSERKTKRT